MPVLQIRKHFRFEAAHALPHHAGNCARMHGHSYLLEVALRGPLQEAGAATGMVADFESITSVVGREIVDRLDHSTLNEFVENPTAENVLLWIHSRIAPALPQLDELVLWETPTACAVLRCDDPR